MQTKLVEFKNQEGEILRGILTIPGGAIKSGAVFVRDGEMEGTIFLQGFERTVTTEKKAKLMADALAERGIASLRFDASGCGLSDGDFSRLTVKKRLGEILEAVKLFQKEVGDMKLNFVAHSLGMCALAWLPDNIKYKIHKMVFIAPALNQKNLLRFYFVRDSMKDKDPNLKITWDNYLQYFDEAAFLTDCRRTGKMMNANFIGPQYFLEGKDFDFSGSFDALKEKILHIHGEFDLSVPLESLNTEFPNRIIVKGGNHDLERPDMWEKWFNKAVDFLTDK